MIYRWKSGFPSAGVAAEAAARQLEKIKVFHHALTSELIVEDSKRPDAALNPYFEWNNAAAAHSWRIQQAGNVLRSLVVVPNESDESVTPYRAYVRVGTEETEETEETELPSIHRRSLFERTEVALADDVMRRRVLQNAWREIWSWRTRYREYEMFMQICAAIDEQRAYVEQQFAS